MQNKLIKQRTNGNWPLTNKIKRNDPALNDHTKTFPYSLQSFGTKQFTVDSSAKFLAR